MRYRRLAVRRRPATSFSPPVHSLRPCTLMKSCMGCNAPSNIYTYCTPYHSAPLLWCRLQTPIDPSQLYIGCDRCQGWFHPTCVGLSPADVDALDGGYFCKACEPYVVRPKKGRQQGSAKVRSGAGRAWLVCFRAAWVFSSFSSLLCVVGCRTVAFLSSLIVSSLAWMFGCFCYQVCV